jgi:hypothetical protein
VKAGAAHGISKRTVERALGKANGKTPKPKANSDKPTPITLDPKPGQGSLNKLDAARGHYLECVSFAKDLDGELEIILFAFREIAGKRAIASQKRASTLPQDGRSEVPMDDPIPENEGDDLGDIPACLDRRSVQKERAASS